MSDEELIAIEERFRKGFEDPLFPLQFRVDVLRLVQEVRLQNRILGDAVLDRPVTGQLILMKNALQGVLDLLVYRKDESAIVNLVQGTLDKIKSNEVL